MGRWLVVLAALWLWAPADAAAQEATPEAPAAEQTEEEARSRTAIEQITVTARKREENLQEVPVAVTAIPATELEGGFNRNLEDLEGITPNLIVDSVRAGPQGAAISIRGISFQDIE
ncbi:MAG: hypothetical protein MJE66_00620, partial [Proteobacteria bacterium]|nr:hypothetical protein [Pseudomonadota bacterium]